MTSRRSKASRSHRTFDAAAESSEPRVGATASARARQEIDLLAVGVALLCAILGFTSRHHLNPDGVSYLDLAVRLREGDWTAFVQGYWSPLYPALLALAGAVTGSGGAPSLPVVHGLHVLLAWGVVALLWRAFRRRDDVILARLGFAAFLLAGTRPPRIDAVTPDLLLLLALTFVALEWLEHGGRRWVRLGLALGAAFLAKTSTWPWLLVALLLSPLLARRDGTLRPVRRSSAVAIAVILAWVVPLSVSEGRPSLGSAGRLNACWYLASCDSRSPDTHGGDHDWYRAVTDSGGTRLEVADFGDAAGTYAPWSDPTAWDRGVRSRAARPPRAVALVDYWARNTVAAVFWLAPLLLGVVLPAYVTAPATPRRFLAAAPRPVLLAVVLGEIGILQFIAVHVEPRLIAPFAFMAALGIVWWRRTPAAAAGAGAVATPPREPAHGRAPGRRLALSTLGLVFALPLAAVTLRDQIGMTGRLLRRLEEIDGLRASAATAGLTLDRIAIVGPALPHLTDAWRVGGRIVAQL
ncbi:MAG TPA: hypothetical protein VLE53_12425, partial [Gemmatimonadaceae bacterium]|nr:hypothetical protein [Gemmatimonadaceae bacterium]